jgi:hypothetical protein
MVPQYNCDRASFGVEEISHAALIEAAKLPLVATDLSQAETLCATRFSQEQT